MAGTTNGQAMIVRPEYGYRWNIVESDIADRKYLTLNSQSTGVVQRFLEFNSRLPWYIRLFSTDVQMDIAVAGRVLRERL